MFRRIILLLCVACSPSWVCGQELTVEVWNLNTQGSSPEPSSTAIVRAYRAANQPAGPEAPPEKPTATGPQNNQYVLNTSALGPLVDVIVRQPGYHTWTVRDLYMGQGGDQKVNVQLFKLDYPIKAPECFAIKTQYELLFRTEERLRPQARKDEIQHVARVKYADGLLALPNPSRADRQPPWVQQMLDEMNPDSRDELDDMIGGLFKLYEMDAFEQFAPSTWKSTYESPSGPVKSEVRLEGNHGTYTSGEGQLHYLEDIDIFYEENNQGVGHYVISGNWRFPPSTGTFRWVIDEGQQAFEGTWKFSDKNQRRPWKGQRVDVRDNGQ